MGEIGKAGRALYAQALWWDTAFVIVHAWAMWVLLRAALGQVAGGRLQILAWLGPIVGCLDLVENACITWLLLDQSAACATLLQVSTSSKLLLLQPMFGLLLAGSLHRLVRALRLRRLAIDQAQLASQTTQ